MKKLRYIGLLISLAGLVIVLFSESGAWCLFSLGTVCLGWMLLLKKAEHLGTCGESVSEGEAIQKREGIR